MHGRLRDFCGWRNEVLTADGKHEEAIKNGIESLRLARLHENEPTLVAYLVGDCDARNCQSNVYDALAAAAVSPELHAAIDEELARHDDPQQLPNGAENGASFWCRTGSTARNDRRVRSRLAVNVFGWLPEIVCKSACWIRWMKLINWLERPWHEVRAEFEPATGKSIPTGHGVLADLLVPALQAAFEANAVSIALAAGVANLTTALGRMPKRTVAKRRGSTSSVCQRRRRSTRIPVSH